MQDIAQNADNHKLSIIKSSLSKKCHTQTTALSDAIQIHPHPHPHLTIQSPCHTIRNTSRIGQLLKFHSIEKRNNRVQTQPSKISRKITINPISHIPKMLHLPSAQYHQSDIYHEYSDFSQRNNSKFTKPEGYFSKFSDNVEKNKALVRRGACQMPLVLFGDQSTMKTTKIKSNADSRKFSQQYSSQKHKQKHKREWEWEQKQKQKQKVHTNKDSNYHSTQPSESQQMNRYPRLNPQKNSAMITPIRKNIDTYVHEYNQLSKSERWMHSEHIKLNNCMNRILGVQMINYWMLGQSKHLKLVKRLSKKQQNAENS